MARILTIDASVFVAACRSNEPGHAESRALLTALRSRDVPLVEPAILPVEVAASLARAGAAAERAWEYAESILALPRLTLVSIDASLARRATTLATRHRLRGADALYVTTAVHYGARLVTLDAEQRKRAPSAVGACQPAALASWLD